MPPGDALLARMIPMRRSGATSPNSRSDEPPAVGESSLSPFSCLASDRAPELTVAPFQRRPLDRRDRCPSAWRRGRGRGSASLLTLTASESGERPLSAERSPPEPEPELTPREVRQREREARRGERPQGMVPGRERRRTKLERGSMRLVATGGIIGIAVVLGAVLVGQDVAGWIVGLVVGLTSVILAALLWSSRQL
jgi:hypothetical protein